MESMPYLIFRLHNSLYAVRASYVREMFYLPMLVPLEESPPFIAGVLNLRGKIVPVIDLDVRFGHAPGQRNLTDAVVVLDAGDVLTG
ncbi:MAG: chemotaxis protein CheW, partial [Deltaproteobacteria bacterium]|nr:chemotaxis protein CheW [Deltaproteobacteria bacterium]